MRYMPLHSLDANGALFACSLRRRIASTATRRRHSRLVHVTNPHRVRSPRMGPIASFNSSVRQQAQSQAVCAHSGPEAPSVVTESGLIAKEPSTLRCGSAGAQSCRSH
jgi:hypothetical protein